MIALLGTIFVFLGGGVAWADTCTSWDAGLTVATKSGGEARALATTWSPVSECDTFAFHSYRVCWDKATATAPTDPASAAGCQIVLGLSTASADHWIHRSDMEFGVGSGPVRTRPARSTTATGPAALR